ncbi:MAG: hypothetical protein P1U63_07730 [Coxiellaceae bacterium]|nr:hypothetical protein [Coxiellaceae bacterium]
MRQSASVFDCRRGLFAAQRERLEAEQAAKQARDKEREAAVSLRLHQGEILTAAADAGQLNSTPVIHAGQAYVNDGCGDLAEMCETVAGPLAADIGAGKPSLEERAAMLNYKFAKQRVEQQPTRSSLCDTLRYFLCCKPCRSKADAVEMEDYVALGDASATV